jgi:hypothetical protein
MVTAAAAAATVGGSMEFGMIVLAWRQIVSSMTLTFL